MARKLSLAALLALSGALSACNGVGETVTSASNRSLYSENQPVVERTDYVLDLSSGSDRLPASEKARLADWFDTLGLGYGDHIWVEEAFGATPNRDDVARVAAEYGLLLDAGAPLTTGSVQPGSVRVIVGRSTASVPGCPNWERKPAGPSGTSSNYGCATNSNLAAMIADPSDLVLGQAGSVSDTATGTKAIKIYRETAPTGTKGLEAVSSRSGK